MNKKFCFGLIILFCTVLTQAVSFLMPPAVFLKIVRPAVYILLLTVTVIFVGADFGFNRHKKAAQTVLLFGSLVYVALLFGFGLIAGFARNPMFTSLKVFLTNLWQYAPFIVIGELLRLQLIKCADHKRKPLMMIFITLAFSFAMLENLGGLKGAPAAKVVEYIMTGVLPVLLLNFFLTYVCANGAPMGTAVLRTVILNPYTYSLTAITAPVLPDISAIFLAILLYAALITMFFLYDKYTFDQRQKSQPLRRRYRWTAYIAPAVILVICVIFGSGLFPARPVAVASNSMKGTFSRGDMLIVKKLNAQTAKETLKEGDIIEYRYGDIDIIHRITEIRVGYDGSIQYITKGDNNPEEDPSPVSPEQVISKAVGVKIPFLGYPSVFLMEIIK